MTKQGVRDAIVIMYIERYDLLAKYFGILSKINEIALDVEYTDDVKLWPTNRMRRQVKNLLKVDKQYFEVFERHFLRVVDTTDKEDMLKFIKEVNDYSFV